MIVGVPLPSTFEVHFSINEEGGIGTAHEATPEYGVLIPDEYLATGEYIYAWIYVNGEDDEERAAAYSIVIPVIKRSSFVPVSFGQGMKGFDLDEDHTLVVVPK